MMKNYSLPAILPNDFLFRALSERTDYEVTGTVISKDLSEEHTNAKQGIISSKENS